MQIKDGIRNFFNKAGVKSGLVAAGLGALTVAAAFNGAVVLAVLGGVATGVTATISLGAKAFDHFVNTQLH